MLRPPSAVAALLLATALLAGGCGGGALPVEYPPQGVDELTIPTPSPDPDDFVEEVDNPWLPYPAGASWSYELDDGGRLTVTVLDESRDVAGVATTVVRREEVSAAGRRGATSEQLVAQDDAGNVWSFGEETPDGSWLAGTDGAQAGLLMPADPRLGDGFVPGTAPGLDTVLTVTSVTAKVTVPAGTWDDVVVIERVEGEEDRAATETWFARGVGPVLVDDGGSRQQLVDFSLD